MTEQLLEREAGAATLLLGDEAVALGALHAGLTAAYGYPGTPSTEILETLLAVGAEGGTVRAAWCSNEKTAYEAALGVSMVGRRALVTMKHVGLNVAADPFMNSALVSIHGGLVVAVADDPGMHSSQNEQDTRVLAAFARTICFEPSDQQEAYAMTREAFEVSERFHVPVVLRLVTRLAHARGLVRLDGVAAERPLSKTLEPTSWILLPANARRRNKHLLGIQPEMRAFAERSPFNRLALEPTSRSLGVITTGVAKSYLLECWNELPVEPSHLHIGTYPIPADAIRRLAAHVDTLLVLEEGYPVVEGQLRGLLPTGATILGKESGELPTDGELTPDVVRSALGLPARRGLEGCDFTPPRRLPQLCTGCPHRDAYAALEIALEGFDRSVVTSDIGCYTLGALPPFGAIESCICMGASIGMARGAAESGYRPAVAVLGDSTFLHSGLPALADVVSSGAAVTVMILDNATVAMTGTQPTILPSERLEEIVIGIGVEPAHCRVLEAHPKRIDAMAKVLRDEIDHDGPSVVIVRRECLESARHRKAPGATS